MFTGLAENELFTASEVQRSIGAMLSTFAPVRTPLLDWLGDPGAFAVSIKHEYFEDLAYPRTIIASTAIASATTETAFQINGFGLALSVGQLLENESVAPELMQITSIVGANSIVASRNYDGLAGGSLAPGGSLFVRERTALSGADHSGADSRRLGALKTNTVGHFRIELAQSNVVESLALIAQGDAWPNKTAKAFRDQLGGLQKGVIRGHTNAAASLGSTTATRTMNGLRQEITAISSIITASSFAANPHLYIGNVWEQAFINGAQTEETWGIIAGSTWYKNISDLNDTKVTDSNASETFQRTIRTYVGPFGRAEVFGSIDLSATELLILPRERVRVIPMQSRSMNYLEMAVTGDNRKALIVGDYSLEVHSQSGMARLRA